MRPANQKSNAIKGIAERRGYDPCRLIKEADVYQRDAFLFLWSGTGPNSQARNQQKEEAEPEEG